MESSDALPGQTLISCDKGKGSLKRNSAILTPSSPNLVSVNPAPTQANSLFLSCFSFRSNFSTTTSADQPTRDNSSNGRHHVCFPLTSLLTDPISPRLRGSRYSRPSRWRCYSCRRHRRWLLGTSSILPAPSPCSNDLGICFCVLMRTADRGGPWSLEVESDSSLLLQKHCCQLSPSSAPDAVTAVAALGAKGVNTCFPDIVRGVVG